MVFLDIVQEVSTPAPESTADENGNVRIDTRKLKTQAAVRSGDTVMLAGLIKDEVGRRSSGFPGLSRIPIIGGLFGQQTSGTGRSEVIILLTPVIIRNRSEEHTSELQSLMRISYAVFCLKKKKHSKTYNT